MNFRMDMTQLEKATKRDKIRRERISLDNIAIEAINFKGKNVVLTGSFPGMTRRLAVQLLTNHGANCQATVNKTTHLVIQGNISHESTKIKAAKNLGIPIIPATKVIRSLGVQR